MNPRHIVMKMSKSSILLLLIIIFLSSVGCNSVNRVPVILDAVQTEHHRHVADQYHLIRPDNFTKGQSYYGYQSGYNAGVRLRVKGESFGEAKMNFSENRLKQRKCDLFQFSIASYKDNDNCYYAEYYSKTQNAMKYEVGVEHNGSMVIVTGYCAKKDLGEFEEDLKKTVKSFYIAE